LTGAGLGGSVVALCPAHGIEAILDAVDRTYYRVRNASEPSVRERFIVVPSDGARASAFTSRLT
jgi:galactokinase